MKPTSRDPIPRQASMHRAEPEIIAYIDGGARGNPGPAAYAVVVVGGNGQPLASLAKFIGETSNNQAEYQGLLAALDYALAHQIHGMTVFSDSELLVRQIRGEYKVKSEGLRPLHQQAQELIARLGSFSIVHVPREQNREADRLVNKTLDAAESELRSGSQPAQTFAKSETLRTTARFSRGVLKLSSPLPLVEGEEVDIEIRRRPQPVGPSQKRSEG